MYLSLAVLKLDMESSTIFFIVATALTVYGIETILVVEHRQRTLQLQQRLPLAVLKHHCSYCWMG